MQVASGRRRWIAVLAVVSGVLFAGVFVSVQATDPVVRFFGFMGDVTIDGEPVQPGTRIVAMVDDIEVGSAKVNQSGAWILDVSTADLGGDPCAVTFVVDGLRAPEEWDCSKLRLRLALVSEGKQPDAAGQADASPEDGDAPEPDESDDQSGDSGAIAADEQTSSADEPAETTRQDQNIVRPASPRTGTGGVLGAEASTNWPRAAAITALVTLGVAMLALLVSRRSDGTA